MPSQVQQYWYCPDQRILGKELEALARLVLLVRGTGSHDLCTGSFDVIKCQEIPIKVAIIHYRASKQEKVHQLFNYAMPPGLACGCDPLSWHQDD